MSLSEKLAAERRGRLAAERLLELKSRELFEANRKLSQHALQLTDRIVEQREEVRTIRSEAEALKGAKVQVEADLERAEEQVEVVERRLWDSVETITDGFAVFDPEDRLVAANTAWLAIFDFNARIGPGTSYLEVLQVGVQERYFNIADAEPGDWISVMLNRWDQPQAPEVAVKLWNGQHYRLIDRRARDGDMVCLAQNVTALKEREAELHEARERAEAANRAKSAFLANMSHELRTPMNGVVAMAEMLLDTALDEEQKLYLSTIKSSGEALLGIINDVLDFSKMEAERLTLHHEAFDLEHLVHDVLTLVAPTLRDKDLSLHVDYDLFLPTRLIGDAGRIRQVLMNLVGNAIKFTTKGHVLIGVVGVEQSDSTWMVHITVEDTGIGIDGDMQDRIFESFSQVEEEQNRQFEGTGLGLSICRELVELMDGKIWVDSQKGRGSCFGFRLPLPSAEEGHTLPRPQPGGLGHAMIAAQPSMNTDILSRQLSQLGLTVSRATTATEALNVTATGAPMQLAFIESRLPDANAAQLVAALRDSGVSARSIVLCHDQHELMQIREATQADAALAYPILRSELFRTLARLADGSTVPRTQAPQKKQTPAAQHSGAAPAAAPSATPAQVKSPPPTGQHPLPTAQTGQAPQSKAPVAPAPSPSSAPVAPKISEAAAQPTAPKTGAPTISFRSRRRAGEKETEVPVSQAPAVSAPVPAAASPPPAAPATEIQKVAPSNGPRAMRVLAAEDNRTNRLVFTKMVKDLDIDLKLANDGVEAVELFESFTPDLIFMDISMPRMDGKAAAQAIRAIEAGRSHVPIVAMTAHALAGDKEEILEAGLDHYLTKPLKKKLLHAQIHTSCPSECRMPVPPGLKASA